MESAGAESLTDFLGSPPLPPDAIVFNQAVYAMQDMRAQVPASNDFLSKAVGALIFPDVKSGGAVLGASRGDGVLIVNGRAVGYYRQQSASVGLQLGVQRYSQVYLFMQPHALEKFMRDPEAWSNGVDATIAGPYAGAKDALVDSAEVNQPVVVFTFNNHGLMAGISARATQIFPRRSAPR